MHKFYPLATHAKRFAIFCMLLFTSINVFATHIVGCDLFYTWQSGNTYKITVILYGDCGPASAVAFASLPTSVPQVCVYNGGTSVTTLNLTADAVSAAGGVEITPVICPADLGHTQCTSTTYTIPGIKKFVYNATYTLPSTSHFWRFVFNGSVGTSTAQRAAAITNIAPGTTMQLIDTLDNTYHNNTSPSLTNIPTPFYCINQPNCYNPGAVDINGDKLRYYLTSPQNGTSDCSVIGSALSYVGTFPAWPGQPLSASTPLQVTTGSYNFDSIGGGMCFTPNFLQRSVVVYNIREYRNDTFIGTCQREVTILVQSCTTPPPSGIYNSATAGIINDSTHFTVCGNVGPFSIFMNPTESVMTNNITVTAFGLPAGLTFTTVNNGTNHPNCTISWNTTSVTPGTYVFYVTFQDDACPINGSQIRAFYITILPGPTVGSISGPTHVCVGSNITLTDPATGGVWSTTSSTVSLSSSGIVTGLSAGTALISYSVFSPSCGTAATTYTVTVDPLGDPGTISGPSAVCSGSSISLTNTVSGGTWSSSSGHATVTSTGTVNGVSPGTAIISYAVSNACGTAYATHPVTVDGAPAAGTITGTTPLCAGSSALFTDPVSGGVWSSLSANATVSSTGLVTAVSAGTATISYTFTNTCGSAVATKAITINPLPNAGSITGPATVCVGSNITLSDATPGGVWSASGGHASVSSGGVVTGLSAGTATISYTMTNSCGTAAATYIVTVQTTPVAGTITGPSAVCIGSTITLIDASPGGTWSSTTGNATVTGGNVTGVAAGTTIISYTVSNSCGAVAATKTITVDALPAPGAISGPGTVCVASSILLTDPVPGGVWSSTSANASITGTGTVTGVNAGTATISYTITNSCGPVAATKVITVNPLPNAGSISGPSNVCIGAAITLTDAAPGGVWTSSSGNATITTSGAGDGLVTGVSAGTAAISYTVTNSCGTATATKVVTVETTPGPISGASQVCVGSSITLTVAGSGGVWSSSSTNASVTSGGVVTGASAGTTTISYTTTNSCGTVASTFIVTINPLPNAGSISGPSSVCVGSTITETDAAPGGIWSSTTGHASVSSGSVTGISAGTTIISYTVTNMCGTAAATKAVTVNPLPNAGTISGPTVVCELANITLTDAATGGVWSSSTGHASISSTGVVSGLTAGTTLISYSVTNVCGTDVATYPVTVNPLPVAGTITGPSVVCVASSITMTDAATGGAWSSTANASVTGAGVVTGVAAGTATISYTVINSCGTANATRVITVNPLPNAGTISGPHVVCQLATITLTESVSTGAWSSGSSNASISSTGIVSGITTGTATMSYTVTNSCSTDVATYVVTVNPLPAIGSITAPSSVCAGVNVTLTATPSGGSWMSLNAHASVSLAGIVTGVSAGLAGIKYTVTNSCGSIDTSVEITVNPQPTVAPITGPSQVCVASNIMLADATPGGVWSSTANASVSSLGLVTGLNAGTATVSYSVTNMCNTAVATAIVTVNPLPGAITGSNNVCVGSTTTLGDLPATGTWISTTSAASVGATTGIVTGLNAGTTTIIYTLPTGCQATMPFTVNPMPNAGTITGPSAVCATVSITLTDAAPGGTWSTSNGNAIAMTGGIIIGAAAGTSMVSYTVTNMCGTAVATHIVTIDPAPDAGNITGTNTVCVGSSVTLTDPAPGGSWNTASTHATVSASGVVTGTSAGVATISYSVTNSCGTANALYVITVNPLPNAGTVTGPAAFCLGSSITLTDAAPGGAWSSTNPNVSLTSGGTVSSTAGGTSTISYTVTNMCGTAVATHPVTVDIFPNAGTITGPNTVCQLASVTLSDATPGGIWSSSTGATVSSTGAVTGTIVGTATITYTVTNTCGSDAATKVITINPLPDPGTVTGPNTLCQGTTITLTDAMPGGTWSAVGGAATISPWGVVLGVSGGTTTISYTVTGTYCPAAATKIITVNPLPNAGTILGLPTVCVSNTLILTDASPGGTWSTADPDVVVSTTGGVYGITPGTAIISYTVTNICGTDIATRVVTINPLPNPGILTGPSGICEDSSFALTASVPGGTWYSTTPSVATVTILGVVHGVGGGTSTISYTVTSGMCSNSAYKVVTINPLPNAGTLSIPAPVCLGTSVTLITSVPGGVWTSDPHVSITPSGVATGLTAGSYYVSYTVTNSCGSATDLQIVTSLALPDPGTITGPDIVCMGDHKAYGETTPSGEWLCTGNASITATGIVTGIAPGTATLTYIASNGVCTATTTRIITINPMPTVAPITGAPGMCLGNTITLADATPGGTWSISGGSASISSTGVVSALTAGMATVSYEVSNSCGSVYALKDINVYGIANAGSISGNPAMCLGQGTTLSSTATGGVWTSTSSTITIVGSTGVVTSVSAGTALISYTVSTGPGCTNVATYPVTVSPIPDAGLLSAPAGYCQGATFTVTATVTGGTWTISDGSVATISNTGSVVANAPGIATITYAVTNGACNNQATVAVTILDGPQFTINGATSQVSCYGNRDGSITTTVSGGMNPVEYLWSTGSTSSSISNLGAGTYTLQVTEPNTKCARSDVFAIVAPDSLSVNSVVHNDECNTNKGKITLTVNGGKAPYTYLWSDNSTGAELNGLQSGSYSVTITDNGACKTDVTLIVADDTCIDIIIHDAITPNGDGVNDMWIIEGLDRYPNNFIQVFDKWGDLIFEERNYNNTWVARGRDGTVVPDGTYFYLLKLYADTLPGGQKVLTGSILIKR